MYANIVLVIQLHVKYGVVAGLPYFTFRIIVNDELEGKRDPK